MLKFDANTELNVVVDAACEWIFKDLFTVKDYEGETFV